MMGTFKARVGINDGNGGETAWVDALVDTGATYSVFPAAMLQDRGITSTQFLTFTFANGEEKELPVGEARFICGDRDGTSKVVFGPEGQYLLGATTLQTLALIADTSRHRLVHAPTLLI